MGSSGKFTATNQGSSNLRDNNSDLSTPKLFRVTSSNSGTGGLPPVINSQTGSVITSNTGGGL